MKRFLQCCAFVAALCAGLAHAQGGGKVEVQWLGQVAFSITSPGILAQRGRIMEMHT